METMERMGRTIFCFAVVAALLTIALVRFARLPAPIEPQSAHKTLESPSPGTGARTMMAGMRP